MSVSFKLLFEISNSLIFLFNSFQLKSVNLLKEAFNLMMRELLFIDKASKSLYEPINLE